MAQVNEVNKNAELIRAHAQLITDTLSPYLPPGTPYAIVDFPDHANVGDSAIWVGEMKILTQMVGMGPRYACLCDDYDPVELRRLHPDGPILIHGGGNLGDLWMRHQLVREAVIRDFKDRTIIQLPQSIQFQSEQRAKDFAALIKGHGAVHVLTRDRRSHDYALERFGSNVKLCPDSAFGIGPIEPPVSAIAEAFCLMREDSEKTGVDHAPLRALANAMSDDWLYEPRSFNALAPIQIAPRYLVSGHLNKQAWRQCRYRYLAEGRVDRGLRMLAQGKVVVTDRLHAHILSVLMGLPNIVLDNNYGKIHGYIDAWTHGAHMVTKVATPEEAVAVLRTML